jgi:hypothetical protein
MNEEEKHKIEATLVGTIEDLVATKGQLVDHVIVVYTVSGDDGEDALGVVSTGHVPRWLAKGMLTDAIDIVKETL